MSVPDRIVHSTFAAECRLSLGATGCAPHRPLAHSAPAGLSIHRFGLRLLGFGASAATCRKVRRFASAVRPLGGPSVALWPRRACRAQQDDSTVRHRLHAALRRRCLEASTQDADRHLSCPLVERAGKCCAIRIWPSEAARRASLVFNLSLALSSNQKLLARRIRPISTSSVTSARQAAASATQSARS